MTYYGGKELAAAFRTVRKNTIQIARGYSRRQVRLQAVARLAVDSARRSCTSRTLTTFPTMLHGERIPIEKIDFPEFMQKVGAEEAKPQDEGGDRRAAAGIAATSSRPCSNRCRSRSLPRSSRSGRARSRRRGRASRCCWRRRSTRCTTAAQLMLMQRMIGIVPHLTREAQERMARFQAQAQPASVADADSLTALQRGDAVVSARAEAEQPPRVVQRAPRRVRSGRPPADDRHHRAAGGRLARDSRPSSSRARRRRCTASIATSVFRRTRRRTRRTSPPASGLASSAEST